MKEGVYMEIYIKLNTKVLLQERHKIFLKDIVEIITEKNTKKRLYEKKIFEVSDTNLKRNYLISVLDIIKLIKTYFPKARIINLGEIYTVVEYNPKTSRKNIMCELLFVAVICVILFVGASTTIMSFHNDANIPQIFNNYYKIFFGTELDNPKIITIPYSIGLATGIVVFFNHLFNKKITCDLTPIEIQCELYEKNIYQSTISLLEKQRKS
jgi:stage V sporulation protein AA